MYTTLTPHVRLQAGRSCSKVKSLTAVLSAWFALGASQALAVPAAGGNNTNVNIGVAACTTLNTQFIPVPAGTTRYCVATGSADVQSPGSVGGTYLFNLTLNNAACAPPDGGMERTVQFSNAFPDNRIKEVTSTGFFVVPAGNNFIRWTARPDPAVAAPATIVIDRSLSVICLDYPL